jgi:hypothetical protein
MSRLNHAIRHAGTIFFILLAAAWCHAQVGSTADKSSWTANPGAIRQAGGKYPATVNVVLFYNACTRQAGAVANPLSADDIYKITPTGSGLSAGATVVGSCTLTTTITIEPGAVQSGYQYLMVSRQVNGTKGGDPAKSLFLDSGFAAFDLLDALAGPTPSTPETDIQWVVLSQHACSDSFGNHVAKIFYCVQVTIGNNSAHSLQVAGVGFRMPNPFASLNLHGIDSNAEIIEPNISYRTSRAVAQNGQATTFRNYLVNGIQSAGLLMAAATPYFINPVSKSKWATGSSIVTGVLGQAIGLVAPDLTIRELNNLDDEALRDGKLIPNNTQASPVMVFVDKKGVTDSLASLQINLEKSSVALEEANSKRADKKNTQGEPVDNSQGQGRSSDSKDKNPNIGLEKLRSHLEKCVKKESCDPVLVKIALGHIVLVGDHVDYIQRVVVDSGVTSQAVAPVPFIANASSLTATAGQTTPVILVGAALDKITVTLDPLTPSTITMGAAVLSGTTSLSLPITVGANSPKSFVLDVVGPSGVMPPLTVTVR